MLSLPQETELLSAFADTPISSRPRCGCLLPYFNKLFRMQKKRFCIKPDAAERYSPYICFRTLYRKKVLIIGIHPQKSTNLWRCILHSETLHSNFFEWFFVYCFGTFILNCSFRFINRLPTHNSVGLKERRFDMITHYLWKARIMKELWVPI